ncbi:UPF0481 protein At3g47200 [Cajanus cajan]|uniref:UPF0481 protein At3g47200 family n=1 Tax=Cajanus cajan TaxID=3821 RepID=A0A151T913_CAJCA|nr:UPF0481 protein At3g47200 [Cajanus cajan]KYP63516.1 UPF0481 protein At3g47200 family [Cajanus cajan]
MNDFQKCWIATGALLDAVDGEIYQPYSIPIVGEELRICNEKAYEPKVVSIGPRFKGRRELLPMEEIKLRCMLHLLNRIPYHDLMEITDQKYIDPIENGMRLMLDLDAVVRASYGEEIKFNSYDLTLAFSWSFSFLDQWNGNSRLQLFDENPLPPSPAAQLGNMELILSDLTLFENQIPFSVLGNLFHQLFPRLYTDIRNYIGLTQHLALSLFGYSRDSSSTSIPNSISDFIPDLINASHILQLVHSFILNHQSHQGSYVVDIHDDNLNKQIEPKCCATRLLAAGVTIVKSEDNSIIPKFNSSKGVLEVPPLHITQTMLAKWLNFIALELHTKRWKKSVDRDVFTLRALLFNVLMCCASDVQLLKNKGIIEDKLGISNHHLMDLFRSIKTGVDGGLVHSTYSNIIHALNTYSATNPVLQFPIILWHYLSQFSEWLYGLNKFLRRGYNFAAALLTLLTVIQTCYTILSYHYPKNN